MEGLRVRWRDLDQLVEITTGKEGRLRRSDDHPGQLLALGGQACHAAGHRLAVGGIHGVGRLAGHVQGQDNDPVGTLFVANGISHGRFPDRFRDVR